MEKEWGGSPSGSSPPTPPGKCMEGVGAELPPGEPSALKCGAGGEPGGESPSPPSSALLPLPLPLLLPLPGPPLRAAPTLFWRVACKGLVAEKKRRVPSSPPMPPSLALPPAPPCLSSALAVPLLLFLAALLRYSAPAPSRASSSRIPKLRAVAPAGEAMSRAAAAPAAMPAGAGPASSDEGVVEGAGVPGTLPLAVALAVPVPAAEEKAEADVVKVA